MSGETALTYQQLADLNPCSLIERKKLFNCRSSLTALEALERGATVNDLLWVAGRLGRKDLCVKFALACAQEVVYLSDDPRTAKALKATQKWLDNPTEKNRAASRAAWAAWAASWAAWAAWAASRAAWAASRAASRAASEAASEAASWAAWAASRAASEAAWAASRAASRAASEAASEKRQRELFIEIFRNA